MACEAFDVESILTHQLRPALVLDSHGTIVAANHGSRRLIAPSHLVPYPNTQNSLLGRHISGLGLVPQPGQAPVLWTWNEILEAAKQATQSEGARRNSNGERYDAMNIDILSDTENFWDEEAEQQGIIETSVYVTRQNWEYGALGTGKPVNRSSMIKARAAVHWLSQGGDKGHFLVTLNRTSLPFGSVPMPVATLSDTVSHFFEDIDTSKRLTGPVPHKPSEMPHSNSSPGIEEPMPGASDIASSIIPFIMATLDTDGQVINFSQSWYRFSGLDEEGSLGAGWMTVMHPDDVVQMTTDWSDVLRNERMHWTHQARFRKSSDGTYCWFLIRVQPYKNASGKVLRWYASMMDINEWVMARLEADRRRQVMLKLFSQTDVMLWGIDAQHHMYICEGRLNWDPSVIEKLSKQDSSDQSAELSGPRDLGRKQLVLTVQAVLRGDEFNPIVEHWEGDRYFRTQFVAERTTPGGGVQAALALTFDITDERARTTLQLENQRLLNNEKAAVEAAKLKSSFLANMSHEIRTPISGIIGLSEHLLECDLSQDQTEFANGILETAKFLLTLINDVLDFSKIESGHMDVESIPFSPYKLINDVLVPLRLHAKQKGLALTSKCDLQADTALLGDPWRMRQILTNLVGNSLKFTDCGHVDLTVRTCPQEKPDIMMLQFIVNDSGVGIKQEVMKALFKPFQQADSSTARLHGGTGLGLVICRQLVELMGGEITLDSSPGQGTTATCNIPFPLYKGPVGSVLTAISLPRRARPVERMTATKSHRERSDSGPHNESKQPLASPIPAPSEPEVHILLVEDNHINRKVITLAIKKLGYTVSTACDGQEALQYLCKQSKQPKPSAVLMDCMMPIIDGYEATRRIRSDSDMFDEQTRRLPIIALTASAIKGDREKCWEAGMDDYLTKPAARDALERTLAKWTASERPHALGRNSSSELE